MASPWKIPEALWRPFLSLGSAVLRCRGCLGPIEPNDPRSRAGLCVRCWEGLASLPEERCSRCALAHDPEAACPEPVAWSLGDALWDYHAGRPPLGALLVPAIKAGEMGWKRALLERVEAAPLPGFVRDVDLVTAAPTAFQRRWRRGFDLAEETALILAGRLERPFMRTLLKAWRRPRQMGQSESRRRLLPRKAILLKPRLDLAGRTLLLVDDVWTTGTTLLRCAQALREGGAEDVRVLTLFRSR